MSEDAKQEANEKQPAIAAAVVVQDSRVLLVQRRIAEGSLSWQFPAGAVEQGESYAHAAVRETAEETALVVEAITVLGERVHPNTGRLMGYVACEVKGGTAHLADADELANLAWVSAAELDDFVPHGFAPVVQRYLTIALG